MLVFATLVRSRRLDHFGGADQRRDANCWSNVSTSPAANPATAAAATSLPNISGRGLRLR
jgi:hypothetical protein